MNSTTSTRKVPPDIGFDDVHVWRVRLDTSAGIETFRNVLSTDEEIRAKRFRADSIQRQFIVTRGALRHILSSYLDETPEELTFETAVNGKPRIAPTDGHENLWGFNVSHSGEIAVVALCRDSEVGVDIEAIRENLDWKGIAKRFFSEDEQNYIFSLEAIERLGAFYRCWTRKESFIKALGLGVPSGLDRFSVDASVGIAASPIVEAEKFGDISTAWHILPINVPTGYEAAVTVKSDITQIRYFDFRATDDTPS